MWKVFVLYWLAIVGAAAAIKLRGSPWPPASGTLVRIGLVGVMAAVIVACSIVAKAVFRRRAFMRRRAIEALDALNVTSASSRAQFLAAAAPFMHSSYSDEDGLANQLWALFSAIRSHPEDSIEFGPLHDLQDAARKQQELEAWSTRWQPTWVRTLVPEFGPASDAMLAASVGPLIAGGIFAGFVLIDMAAGPLWGLLWWAVVMVLFATLLGVMERRLDRFRDQFRAAVPDLCAEDGSPKIPERYDRTRN